MWQPNRYAKINLKITFKFVHTARQNISISSVGTVVIVDFKTLKPVVFSSVFCSFARSAKVYFAQEWGKKKENHLDGFSVSSVKIFPYQSVAIVNF